MAIKKKTQHELSHEPIDEKHLEELRHCSAAEYERILSTAKSQPFEQYVVEEFFVVHEQCSDFKDKDDLVYHKLKYLHKTKRLKYEMNLVDNRWMHLNAIADIEEQLGHNTPAFMCWSESLRLKPDQPKVYERMQQLKPEIAIRFPQKLRKNRCGISVLIVTKNRPDELRAAIGSVLEQTFEDYEIIVYEDGGDARAKTIVDSFASEKIRFNRLEKSIGYDAALNLAIEQAEGKYLAFLDDDDVYYPDHLEKSFQALEANPGKVVHSAVKGVEGTFENGVFEPKKTLFTWQGKIDRDEYVKKNCIGNLCLLFPKSMIRTIGFPYEDCFSADWESWLRLMRKFEFLSLDHVCGEYRFKQNNVCVQHRYEAHFCGDMVGQFQKYHMGDIAEIKYLLHYGQRQAAYEIYRTIVRDYQECFKTVNFLDEMILLAERFGDHLSEMRFTRDLCVRHPRVCWKEMIRNKSIWMFPAMLSAMFIKLFRKQSRMCR